MSTSGNKRKLKVKSVLKVARGASFRETGVWLAECLTDGVKLPNTAEKTIMPWVGFGTYRLGAANAYEATLQALKCGYRCIDTAFIYGGEKTEKLVGQALQTALSDPEILTDRSQVFVITKHWRKYHGYDPTLECLRLSLKRLQLDYVDLWLMHWPGPAWTTMNRRKDEIEANGPWHYSAVPQEDMVKLRAETWRAMEDAQKEGKVKAIGVSNFQIHHLETLKKTATQWPPAVNQVECHPLYPQDELRAYCKKEGIVLQAYAALGGQDGTKVQWKTLLDGHKLIEAPIVLQIAQETRKTPAQVLSRWALQRECAMTPKTSSKERMEENAQIFDFRLSDDQMKSLSDLKAPGTSGRLCWRSDPLRLLEFD